MDALTERRERVFLVLAGTFLASMTLLNVVGITHFIQLGPMALAVGVLPYPLTFLCTDLVSELYGKRRANFMVWVGLFLNLFVIGIVWMGNFMTPVGAEAMPPWQTLNLSSPVYLPNGDAVEGQTTLFYIIYACTAGSVFASMVAYVAAQFCDVQLFHFWKKLTKGKHMWLRNNGSTIVSQLVDSVMVISITFGAAFMRGEKTLETMFILLGSNYFFKVTAALMDTIPFYFITGRLRGYLEIPDGEEIG